MVSKNYEGTGYLFVGVILGIVFTWAVMEFTHLKDKHIKI